MLVKSEPVSGSGPVCHSNSLSSTSSLSSSTSSQQAALLATLPSELSPFISTGQWVQVSGPLDAAGTIRGWYDGIIDQIISASLVKVHVRYTATEWRTVNLDPFRFLVKQEDSVRRCLCPPDGYWRVCASVFDVDAEAESTSSPSSVSPKAQRPPVPTRAAVKSEMDVSKPLDTTAYFQTNILESGRVISIRDELNPCFSYDMVVLGISSLTAGSDHNLNNVSNKKRERELAKLNATGSRNVANGIMYICGYRDSERYAEQHVDCRHFAALHPFRFARRTVQAVKARIKDPRSPKCSSPSASSVNMPSMLMSTAVNPYSNFNSFNTNSTNNRPLIQSSSFATTRQYNTRGSHQQQIQQQQQQQLLQQQQQHPPMSNVASSHHAFQPPHLQQAQQIHTLQKGTISSAKAFGSTPMFPVHNGIGASSNTSGNFNGMDKTHLNKMMFGGGFDLPSQLTLQFFLQNSITQQQQQQSMMNQQFTTLPHQLHTTANGVSQSQAQTPRTSNIGLGSFNNSNSPLSVETLLQLHNNNNNSTNGYSSQISNDVFGDDSTNALQFNNYYVNRNNSTAHDQQQQQSQESKNNTAQAAAMPVVVKKCPTHDLHPFLAMGAISHPLTDSLVHNNLNSYEYQSPNINNTNSTHSAQTGHLNATNDRNETTFQTNAPSSTGNVNTIHNHVGDERNGTPYNETPYEFHNNHHEHNHHHHHHTQDDEAPSIFPSLNLFEPTTDFLRPSNIHSDVKPLSIGHRFSNLDLFDIDNNMLFFDDQKPVSLSRVSSNTSIGPPVKKIKQDRTNNML